MAHTEKRPDIKRPHIRNIILSSVDGRIALHPWESTHERKKNDFSCDTDFFRLRQLTSLCDVVFIGAQTIESEQGAFRTYDLRPDGSEPEWIVFTRSGEISFQSPFWQQKNIPKKIFYVSSFCLSDKPEFHIRPTDIMGETIPYCIGNITGLFDHLNRNHCKQAALLGGGKLNAVFWEQGLVDALHLTISPFVIGHKDAPGFLHGNRVLGAHLELKHFSTENGFLYLDYDAG